MKNEKLTLATPWMTYKKMLDAMFQYDADVIVGDIEDEGTVKRIAVEVKNHKKFLALSKIINTRVVYGNITVAVDLYDEENKLKEDVNLDTIKDAFEGNEMVDDVKVLTDVVGTDHIFVVFDNTEIIQFFNDNLTDYCGNYTGLPEDVARQLFNTPWGIQFCTKDLRENNE